MSKFKFMFMSRNPHTYSDQIQVEEPDEVVALQTYLRSKYGLSYDYDFLSEEWFNPNWFQDHATYDYRWNKMSSDIFHFAHVEDFAQALLLIDKARESRKVVLALT